MALKYLVAHTVAYKKLKPCLLPDLALVVFPFNLAIKC